MVRIVCIVFILLSLAGSAHGQGTAVVPDTLDWRRYYPLEVGNTWEYGKLVSYISTIVGDTLANGHRYFVQRDSFPPAGSFGPLVQTYFVRYDTAGAVLLLPDIEADTVAMTPPVYFDAEGIHSRPVLPAAFGDTLFYGAPDTLYYVSGGYNQVIEIGYESVEVAALKCFYMKGAFLSDACYATDIGFVWGGNLSGPQLEYARVNGVEYGNRVDTPVERQEALPAGFRIDSIYPNPVKDRITIVYRAPGRSSVMVEVFNVLGQRILLDRTTTQGFESSHYALSDLEWPAGIYLIRLTTEAGEQSIRSTVVTN